MNESFDEPLSMGEPGPSEDVFPRNEQPQGASNGNGNGNSQHASRVPRAWQPLLNPHDVDSDRFIWPGWEGFPFRGDKVSFLKEGDSESRQPQISYEPFVWILDLSNEKDLRDYQDVYQLVVNNAAVISAEERQYDPDKKNWRVFLRWALVYAHMPKEMAPRA